MNTNAQARDAFGNEFVQGRLYAMTCDYKEADDRSIYVVYGYVDTSLQEIFLKSNNDAAPDVILEVIARRQQTATKVTRQCLPDTIRVASCMLYPVPESVVIIPRFSWDSERWAEDGTAVLDVRPQLNGTFDVLFYGMPYWWPYNADGTPCAYFSWLPTLVNKRPANAVDVTSDAPTDQYEIGCVINGTNARTLYRLTKMEAVYIAAARKIWLTMQYSNCVTPTLEAVWRVLEDTCYDPAATRNKVIDSVGRVDFEHLCQLFGSSTDQRSDTYIKVLYRLGKFNARTITSTIQDEADEAIQAAMLSLANDKDLI